MGFRLEDNVQMTTTHDSTGSVYYLDGTASGFRTWAGAGYNDADTCLVSVWDDTDIEVFEATYNVDTPDNKITRTRAITATVNWPTTDPKNIAVTFPAEVAEPLADYTAGNGMLAQVGSSPLALARRTFGPGPRGRVTWTDPDGVPGPPTLNDAGVDAIHQGLLVAGIKYVGNTVSLVREVDAGIIVEVNGEVYTTGTDQPFDFSGMADGWGYGYLNDGLTPLVSVIAPHPRGGAVRAGYKASGGDVNARHVMTVYKDAGTVVPCDVIARNRYGGTTYIYRETPFAVKNPGTSAVTVWTAISFSGEMPDTARALFMRARGGGSGTTNRGWAYGPYGLSGIPSINDATGVLRTIDDQFPTGWIATPDPISNPTVMYVNTYSNGSNNPVHKVVALGWSE